MLYEDVRYEVISNIECGAHGIYIAPYTDLVGLVTIGSGFNIDGGNTENLWAVLSGIPGTAYLINEHDALRM